MYVRGERAESAHHNIIGSISLGTIIRLSFDYWTNNRQLTDTCVKQEGCTLLVQYIVQLCKSINDLIDKSRNIKSKYHLTTNDVYDIVLNNHDYVSSRTLERFFAEKAGYNFRYKSTIKPIYDALIGYDEQNNSTPKNDFVDFLLYQIKIKDTQINKLLDIIRKVGVDYDLPKM